MKELAIEFKKARIKQGLTQKDVSAKSKVMQCTISRYESGLQSISIITAIKLAKAINNAEFTELITKHFANYFKS